MSHDEQLAGSPPPQDEGIRPREAARQGVLLWAVALLAVIALALLASQVGVVAANLYALVACVFVGLPYAVWRRRGEDPADFGMTARRWRSGLGWGLAFTALTLPPFAVGLHVWETQVLKHRLVLSTQSYAHWPLELEGQPARWGESPGAWVWSHRGVLYLGMRAAPGHQNKLVVEGSSPFIPVHHGGVQLKRLTSKGEFLGGPLEPSTTWELIPKAHHRPVMVMIQPVFARAAAPDALTIRQSPEVAGSRPWPVHQGADAALAPGDEAMRLTRGYLWIVLWSVTQLFFIALPEECFYRGFVQTRLEQARPGARAWLGVSPAIVATSVLFGLGHWLVPVGGALLVARMSVFFPSLLFGWLRRRTGSIVAPTIYHACCNMMVLLLSTHYY